MLIKRYAKPAVLALVLAATTAPSAERAPDQLKSTVDHYAVMVHSHYSQLLDAALKLQTAVVDFVAAPTGAGLKVAKERWIETRLVYGPSEVYRFYGGPIDDPEKGPEGLINAWPLDEIYIDGTGVVGGKGIIDQPLVYPVISAEVLQTLNEAGSEKNIATGFHAVEFLLWGQDLENGQPQKASAGLRRYTDFLEGQEATSPHGERRRAYLVAVSDLLVKNLTEVRNAWDAQSQGSYAIFWQKTQPTLNLTKMLTSMATLSYSELAGERMFTAVDEHDQEHEQSCFSDMTHSDIAGNFTGVENLYFGRLSAPSFTSPHGEDFQVAVTMNDESGAGVRHYLHAVDPDLVVGMDTALDQARAKIAALPIPFDNALLTSQQVILDAVNALRQLGLKIQEAGRKMDLNVTIEPADGD